MKFLCANVCVSVSMFFELFFFGPFLPFVFFLFQFVFILSYCYSLDICFLRDRVPIGWDEVEGGETIVRLYVKNLFL